MQPAPQSRSGAIASSAAIGAATLLIVAGAFLADANFHGIETGDMLADRMLAAQIAAGTLLSTLKDAETGQRGYLLTGDAAYLEPYDAARARLPDEFHRLEEMSRGDPQHGLRIARIRGLVDAKLGELDRTITLRRAGHAEDALELVRTNQGRLLMDTIRTTMDALQADAAAKLARTQVRRRAAHQWSMAVGLVTLACVMLGWVALLQRKARLRAIASLSPQLDRFTRAFGLVQGMMRSPDGRITFWSEGNERLYGYPSGEALGHSSHELLCTEFPMPLPDIGAALLRDGQWQGDLVHRRRDGMKIHVASRWVVHREAGEADAIIEVSTDISSLKRIDEELRESALKLRLALDASDLGIWRWELGDDGRMEWDARCRTLFGLAEAAAPDYAAWISAIRAEDRASAEAAVARALNPLDLHDEYISEYRAVHPDGRMLWLAATGRAQFEASPRTPAGRRILRLLCTIRDVSSVRQSEQERQQADALLRTIVEAAPVLIFAKDRQGRMLLANQPVMDLIGKPWAEVAHHTDLEFLDDPAQAEAVMANDRRLMELDQTETLEERVSSEPGVPRIWFVTKAPLRDQAGAVIGLVGVSIEITERKRFEQRLRLMIDELNHRVKNTLATVQSIASQTMRGADIASRKALEGRLQALAAIHDVLMQAKWGGVDLADIVAGVLAPHGGTGDGRIAVSGCTTWLTTAAAQALGIGLHELTVNALRHGALSSGYGQVSIHWEVTKDAVPLLRLEWMEQGGPRVVPPDVCGFGTRIVERGMAQGLGAVVRVDFTRPEGVTCLIEMRLAEVTAPPETALFPEIGDARGRTEC